MPRRLMMICVAALLASSCGAEAGIVVAPERNGSTTTTTAPPQATAPFETLALEPVALDVTEPVAIAAAPHIHDTFIVERPGRVVTTSSGGQRTVLAIESEVGSETSEQGMLGMAVHPSFPDDPRAFVTYTNTDFDLVVSSFEWTGDGFDVATEEQLLIVPQPHKYHQGGGLTFGPSGYLWISLGDGGGTGDRHGNGQNLATLKGTVSRIDVDHGDPYAVPPDNPFIDTEGARPEVWAYGLRNPWRITLDSGHLLIADVGQEGADEIDIVDASSGGYNFGWPIVEGDECYGGGPCDTSAFTPPALVVERRRTCAVIGGPVYRGSAIPELFGHYFFGDFCVGWVRTAPFDDGELGPVTDWERELGSVGYLTSFGVDHDGEILVADFEGSVHRIVAVRDGP